MSRATAASISHAALRHNLAELRRRAPNSRVMAVVKADAYGHGLERVASVLRDADAFGVAALSDAERIRDAGLDNRVVLLSGFDEPEDLPVLRRLKLDAVVHCDEQLRMLELDARSPGADPLRVWVKLDTGMNRLGFRPERVGELQQRLGDLRNVHAALQWMSHLARSDEFDVPSTPEQLAAFDAAMRDINGDRSLANSAAILGWPASHRDWIRPGGALYGMSVVDGKTGADFGLKPAMSLHTRLIAVKEVRAGDCIGYGGTHVCERDGRIGIAAIGYGDGYPRLAPAGTPVLVDGKASRIVGRVSMDLMAIDLDGCPGAQVGSPVLLWGPELPIETIASAAGTISYELACGITRRVRFMDE